MPASDTALGAELLRRAAASTCCRPDRGLLALLREDAEIYEGKGSVEADRLWAFVLECVSRAGLAREAMPFILEELETGTDPYTVAAAARALRRLDSFPEEAPALLARAVARMRHVDEYVRLDCYPVVPTGGGVTAVSELEGALAAVGRPCFGYPIDEAPSALPTSHAISALHGVLMQDQDGATATFLQRFGGRAGLIAFFYTRCMNPDKCSRTVSQLAEVREMVADTTAVVAGITYDPAYDGAERLRRYGAERGLRFGPACSLLRSEGPFDPFREAFGLGVGFGSSTVNRHTIELFILDAAGLVVEFKGRRLWDVNEVAAAFLAVAARTTATE